MPVSLLSELEPMLGISFAVSLAYLGLPKFRYREAIKVHAAKRLALLSGDDVGSRAASSLVEATWYTKTLELAELGEHLSNGKQHKASKSAWDFLYTILFKRRTDRKLIGFGAVVFATLILCGVGQRVGAAPFDWFLVAFSEDFIGYWFWFCFLFSVAPIVAVWCGRFTVAGACAYVDENVENMLKALQAKVQLAPFPIVEQATLNGSPD